MTSIASDLIDKYDPPIGYNKILPALFQNNLFEKYITELDFKDLIKILFSKLDFEKLEKLISLILEKYYTTHKPTCELSTERIIYQILNISFYSEMIFQLINN